MDLNCREFDYTKNLNEQRKLFHDAFPEVKDSSTQDYLWLLQSFPNEKDHSFEYAAYINNEMVGYYAAIPYSYKIQNATSEVGMVCGVMTSSKHRGKGIFTKLGEYSTNSLAAHVPFTTGYPIRKEVIPGHLKVGWKIAFELPLYIKFLKSNSLLEQKAIRLKFLSPLLNLGFTIYNNVLTSGIKNREYQYKIYDKINDISNYDNFINNWIQTVPNALIKNSEFARWRYGAPNKSYKFIVITKNEEICGFCSYTHTIKEGVPSYCILDISVLEGYFDCVNLIYSAIYSEAKKNNIEAIMLMMSKLSAKKYKLIRNGFLKSPFKFHLIIKNLTNQFKDKDLFEEKNWHLMWVDSDDL